MKELMRDVRHATRRLVRTPMFTLATVLTLALGIGANVAIFSIVNTVLLKPLPFHEADRLVGLWQTAPGVDIADLNASLADYITYREESRTLADVALWNRDAVTITGLAQPERLDSLMRDPPPAAAPRGPADDRPAILGAGRSGRQPGSRHAEPRLLATPVRRRHERRRPVDHRGRHPARDHRRAPEGLLVHGRPARSRAADALQPGQRPAGGLQQPARSAACALASTSQASTPTWRA